MSLIGWLQISLLFLVVLALVKPLGLYMARGLLRRAHLAHPGRWPGRARLLRARRRRREEGAGLARLHARDARLQRRRLRRALRDPAAAGLAAAQSAGLRRRAARSRLQHRRQLRHQHQLAVLWRRDDDEPFQPDGRAHGAELRLRRHRHRPRARRDPRASRARARRRSAISGSISPAPRSTCCCRCRSSWRSPSSRWACRRRSRGRSRRRRSRAPSRPSRSGRSRARRRSSSSAPMAAASSTSTPRIPSRTRPRCRTTSTSSPCSSISAALVYTFGQMVGDRRQGWAFIAAMAILLIAGVGVVYWAETAGNPILTGLGLDPALGNMEGKEVRFGQAMTAAYAAVTTGLSDGGVNGMHGSFTGLGGLVPMFLIQLGEVLPGGVGSGLYGMVVFAILAVFVAGLMVGRTPEFLGKKIESREMKYAVLAILILPLAILGFTAVSAMLPSAVASVGTGGPHGLSEILYAYTSAAGNNGSAFGGLIGQHAVVQHHARHRHAARPLRLCRPGAGDRRLAGGARSARPASKGTFPTAWAALRRPAHRHHPDPRRPAVLPRARPWPDRRAFRHARRPDLLRRPHMSKTRLPAAASIRRSSSPRRATAVRQARSARSCVRNPVIFVTEVVAALVTLLLPARPRRPARTARPSPARSPPGCGSPCSSPPSPRPWPRGAARRRPTACAAPSPS